MSLASPPALEGIIAPAETSWRVGTGRDLLCALRGLKPLFTVDVTTTPGATNTGSVVAPRKSPGTPVFVGALRRALLAAVSSSAAVAIPVTLRSSSCTLYLLFPLRVLSSEYSGVTVPVMTRPPAYGEPGGAIAIRTIVEKSRARPGREVERAKTGRDGTGRPDGEGRL